MAEMDSQNISVTLKSEEHRAEDEVVVSFSAIIKKLKKYFLVWFLVAVILGGTIAGVSIALTTTSVTPVTALVSFTYAGIEKGKNPDGTTFNANSIKNPDIIEYALKECNLDPALVETVRQDTVIEGIVPEDAIDRITGYYKIFEDAGTGSLNAVREIMDTTWYSTQYQISFKFKEAGIRRADAVSLVNSMLNRYKDYFYEQYGVNNALGVSLGAMDYKEYDYSQAVDMFDTALNSLRRYVNSLATEDNTQFRSTVTGYTFSDLTASIRNVQDLDLAVISSYLTVNNITKDKERVAAYYDFRIDALEREQTVYEKELTTIEDAIAGYEKDQVYIFGNSDGINTQSSIASDQYDRMIRQRITVTSDLAETIERIAYYQERLAALRKPNIGSQDKIERIEEDLVKVSDKINTLIQLVEDTAKDYYENVELADAFAVLVPPNSNVKLSIKNGIKQVLFPIVGLELVLMMAYIALAFVKAMVEETEKRRNAKDVAALSPATEGQAEAAAQPKDSE